MNSNITEDQNNQITNILQMEDFEDENQTDNEERKQWKEQNLQAALDALNELGEKKNKLIDEFKEHKFLVEIDISDMEFLLSFIDNEFEWEGAYSIGITKLYDHLKQEIVAVKSGKQKFPMFESNMFYSLQFFLSKVKSYGLKNARKLAPIYEAYMVTSESYEMYMENLKLISTDIENAEHNVHTAQQGLPIIKFALNYVDNVDAQIEEITENQTIE